MGDGEKGYKGSTWADIPPETAELGYRRGYCDGWVQALDAMHDLLFKGRMSREEAYEYLWEYGVNGPLADWRGRGHGKKADRMEFPPEPTVQDGRTWAQGRKG